MRTEGAAAAAPKSAPFVKPATVEQELHGCLQLKVVVVEEVEVELVVVVVQQ